MRHVSHLVFASRAEHLRLIYDRYAGKSLRETLELT
jgi:hypothetical protein